IVDAHVHTGYPGIFFSPEVDAAALVRRMDRLRIQYAVNLSSMHSLQGATLGELENAQRDCEESGGRVFFCGFFDPRRADADLAVLEKGMHLGGFRGIKIHPSFNKVSAEDPRYDAVWSFAAQHGLPIVAHTWSVSSYNPVQVLSTPDKFEPYVTKYPEVRFVLAHSGGRGEGQREAVRMAREHPNVYMDFAGDIYCQGYFEGMAEAGILDRVLFGSDYPWIDARSHLTRVYLADLPVQAKQAILRDNALRVYGLE
ncbi:MAG: amidohydrolase, partial [Spirochaetales bacterium]|nr:amidohydrolase [Spirochaetales bacterium]